MNVNSPLSGQWDALFKDVEALNAHALKGPIAISNSIIRNYDISGAIIPVARFENTRWENVEAKNIKFGELKIRDSVINGTNFFQSIIGEAIFENVIFENVIFVSSNMANVKFINCKIHNAQIRNLKSSKIDLVNSILNNSPMYQSEIELKITNSELSESNFMGLVFGSSLIVESSNLNQINLDKSKLAKIIISNSNLMETTVQDSIIDEIFISNSRLDISFANSDLNKANFVEVESKLLGLVDANVNEISIKSCKKGGHVALGGEKFTFNLIAIDNCSLDFEIPWAKGGELLISNTRLEKANFEDLRVSNLIIDNVEFAGETNFDNAQANKSQVRKIKREPSATVTAKGSNIRFY